MLYYLSLLLARRSPMLLLSLAGIIFAIIRWKRHPRVSLMTVLALAIHMFEGILFSIFLYWLPQLMFKTMHLSAAASENFYFVLFFLEDFVFALVIILLVGAAYSGRDEQDLAYPPPPGTI